MIREKLFYTLNIGQVTIGTLMPLLLLGSLQLLRKRVPELVRRRMIFGSAVMILIGVLAMRWNVVIGGQLFSKSLRGVMGYKLEFAGVEGWFMGLVLLSLPFIILTVLVKLFLSERLPTSGTRRTTVPRRKSSQPRDGTARSDMEIRMPDQTAMPGDATRQARTTLMNPQTKHRPSLAVVDWVSRPWLWSFLVESAGAAGSPVSDSPGGHQFSGHRDGAAVVCRPGARGRGPVRFRLLRLP